MSSTTLRRDPARLMPPRLAEALFEATPGGLVVTDARGTIQWTDRCFARWCGLEADELRGMCITEVMPGVSSVLLGARHRKDVVFDATVQPPRGAGRAVRVRAARSGRRSSGTMVWFMSEDAPFQRGTHEASAGRNHPHSPVNESFHLDALRLLHELACSPPGEETASSEADPHPLEALPTEPVPMD